MDSTTHAVIGIGLGGLAMLDPSVAHHPATFEAVMIGTFIGSEIPDIDFYFKLRNNATYIQHHRGFSHSMPAAILWSIFIAAVILPFLPRANVLHLWMWTVTAIGLHIFVDIFNAYGTQVLRPFSRKWIRLGVIAIFDPVIFFAHLAGIFIWGLHWAPPGIIFVSVYILLFFYYLWRIWAHHRVKQKIKQKIPNATFIDISPSLRWSQWHAAIRTPEKLIVAEINRDGIDIFNTHAYQPIPDDAMMKKVKKDKNIRSFLAFSPIYHWEIEECSHYHEVRFIDLRYRGKDGHYPFVAIVFIDEELNIISSYTGWVHSEDKLQKKLRLAAN